MDLCLSLRTLAQSEMQTASFIYSVSYNDNCYVKYVFTQPLHSGRMWHEVNFYAEFNRFEFRVVLLWDFAQSAWAVEFTDCFSAEVRPLLPTSALDMTLNSLMVRFQWYWSFGECRAPLHCHRFQIHSGPE